MENRKQIYINRIFATLVFAVATYFILGEIFLPSDNLDDAYVCTEYTGQWERVTEAGEKEPFSVPGRCEAGRNEVVTLETKLPDTIKNVGYLCFRSAKQDMKFSSMENCDRNILQGKTDYLAK